VKGIGLKRLEWVGPELNIGEKKIEEQEKKSKKKS